MEEGGRREVDGDRHGSEVTGNGGTQEVPLKFQACGK